MDLLTRKEAASLLRVSLPTLDRMLREHQLPVIRLGHSVRFKRSSLIAMLDGLETVAATGA